MAVPIPTDLARLSEILEPAAPASPLPRRNAAVLPVLRPKLPAIEEILPYFRSIDERQWYSNWGPLTSELEQSLSRQLGLERVCVVTTANATAGLTAALLALGLPRGSICVMPSWTFAATPHAARAAGLRPWFHDVDPQTWALDPEAVRRTIGGIRNRVSAAVVVAPFGAPVDTASWEDFEDRTGIRVVIDAAAAFDTVRACRLPSVVSLHATKILAAGEGGFVATTDSSLRDRIVACCNFGFQGSRSAMLPALNGKMSEYHAAVGLASLAKWPATRARHIQIAAWYRRRMEGLPGVALQPGYGGWASGTTSPVLPIEAARVSRRLRLLGVETRSWWGMGCHLQPAFARCPRGPLAVTERLGMRVLGLPHFPEMRESDVDLVAGALAECLWTGPRAPMEV